MQYALKFDIIDQYFPWRRFAAECYSNGFIPFWNPYQHFGYAFSADPQSGAWYPIVWLAGLTGGYNIYFNQLEFFIHIVLAGTGMYLLIKYLTSVRKVALLAGIVFMLSGFFIGNAQHLTYIISGAWFSFIIYYYLRMSSEFKFSMAALFAISLFMMAAGGYPAFTIITGYILLALFLWKLIHYWKDKSSLIFFIRINIIGLITAVLLLSFVLVTTWQSLDFIAKSNALPLKTVLFNPFSPQSLISLLWPLVTTTDYSFFETDMSMANIHIGIVFLLALLFFIPGKKTKNQWAVLGAGIFFLMASFGRYTPLREWLYDLIPFMNLFRFPSIFRFFALFCFVILASFCLKTVFNDKEKTSWFYKILIGVLILNSSTGMVLAVCNKATVHSDRFFSSGWYDFIQQTGFWDAMLLQSVVLAILTIVLLLVNKIIKPDKVVLISVFAISEMLAAAQINSPKTVYGEFTTSQINQIMAELPLGFPVPENQPIKNYSDSTGFISPFWRNLSMLRKQPGFDGYNSFKMLYYDSVADNSSLILPVIENPVAFSAVSYSFYHSTIQDFDLIRIQPAHLFLNDSLKEKTPEFISAEKHSVEFTEFTPEKVTIRTNGLTQQLVTLMQHFHPMWKVSIDRKPASYLISDYMMMTVPVEAGNHSIEFQIHNLPGIWAFRLTVVVLIILLVVVLSQRFR